VYLGAYRLADALAIGGYAVDVDVNEDSEFAIRMGARGGVWYDPSIRSRYVPRPTYRALGKQFFRYGRARVTTLRRHPEQVRVRQVVAPALVLGLLTPQRRAVAAAYGALLLGRGVLEASRRPDVAVPFTAALPVMHLAWGAGFLVGLVSPPHPPTAAVDAPQLAVP
jgi:succinoglycan biosynthesis protein ExoA